MNLVAASHHDVAFVSGLGCLVRRPAASVQCTQTDDILSWQFASRDAEQVPWAHK